MDVSRRSVPSFGRVTARRLRSERLSPSRATSQAVRATLSCFTWRPNRLIRENVVTVVPLALNCVTISRRRDFEPPPELGPHAWIMLASVGGHAILQYLHPETAERHGSYHTMRLVYELAPRLSENLARSFRRFKDLYIPSAVRAAGEIDILPDDIGLDARGRGHRWGVRQLAEAGRHSAADLGIANPTDEDLIRLGVRAAAQKRPIDVSSISVDEARALIFLGLFDFGPADEAVDPAVAEVIIGRLVDALEKHKDDTTAQFHHWFLEEFDNIVHQISKRKRPGGQIKRSIVRQAILGWVFKAFRYVGDCVHVQAKVFADACRPRLSRHERAVFSAIYERQPYLGDMPLILFHEQLPMAREAVRDLMTNPSDPQKAGVFLRALQFHAEMVRKKRESEREYKRLRQHRNRQNKSAVTFSLDKAPQIAAASDTKIFQEIAAELRERRGAKCKCKTTVGWFAEIDLARSRGSRIVIIDCCTECGYREEHRTTAEEIKRIRDSL